MKRAVILLVTFITVSLQHLPPAKAGALARSGTRKLFSLFVYHEESLLSSGYGNWDALGCGVFTDTTKTMEFVDFMTDSDNRVGELNLDIVPLYKNFNTLIENYDVIINNATTHNISINFLESNLIPGDSCQENCPESCSAAPNSRNDSCTPTYMNLFHNTTATLFERYSKNSAFDYEFGLVYDIEQSDPTVNRDVVWDSISKLSNEFDTMLKSKYNSMLTGTSIVRPSIQGFKGPDSWLNLATKINHMKYFTPLVMDWQTSKVSSDDPGSIVSELKYCSTGDATLKAENAGRCRVQIGWEVSAEPVDCKTYHHCSSSFVWGGGLQNTSSLVDWIENTFEPYLLSVGIDAKNDLAETPYFVEHHAAFMAYQHNLKTPGAFPAINCFRKESGCSTCCPRQRHKGVFCTE